MLSDIILSIPRKGNAQKDSLLKDMVSI